MEEKNELKMLENDMVPVYETSTGEKVVYGSELYSCLGSKRQYADWIKSRFTECDAVENEDYQGFSQNCEKPIGGRPKQEYIIKLEIAKEMSMLERNEKGKQVRRYFIQVEKKYKAVQIQQNEKIVMALDNLSERVRTLEGRQQKKPALPDDLIAHEIDTESRVRKFDRMVSALAELLRITKPKFLHMLYRVMDKRLDISLDQYREEYGEKNLLSREANTFRVICSSDGLYSMALDICQETFGYMCRQLKEN